MPIKPLSSMPPKTPNVESAELAAPARVRLAHGLRDFARAVRHIHDLNTFLEIFQVGLEKTGVCSQADFRVQLPDATNHRPAAFTAGRMSVPVMADGQIVTVGQVTPPVEKQHFGAEDLQTLSALAELLGAAIDLAHRQSASEQSVAALKAILSFAPVGICAFDEHGKVEAINTLARGWLALVEGDSLASALPAGTSLADLRKGTSFHLRVSGRLLYGEARPQPGGHFGALVVTDLTPEQGRLLDALTREVYRANHLRRPLLFVLLERAQPIGSLLAALPSLRTKMGRAAIVGPYDASRIGLIFPESSWSAAVLQLRGIDPTLVLPAEVRVGRGELVTFEEAPEALIDQALTMTETLAQSLRPRILVHDEYRGVGDALRLVLGAKCEIADSTEVGEARRLLSQQHFDAILTDLNANGGGGELIELAKMRNPGVQAFYLSSLVSLAESGRPQPTGIPVFSKPFDVGQVRDRILAALTPPAGIG